MTETSQKIRDWLALWFVTALLLSIWLGPLGAAILSAGILDVKSRVDARRNR